MVTFHKSFSSLVIGIVFALGVTLSIGLTNPTAEAEAVDTPVTVTLPTVGTDSTTAFTTTTIFSGTGGLTSTGQTIINKAYTVTNVFVGVNGYLFGDTNTAAGTFLFKTSSYVSSISATFTKYGTDLSTVYIRSGGIARSSSSGASGEIQIKRLFTAEDTTVTLTWTPVASYYFTIGNLGAATTTSNNVYLTSINITYNDTMKLSLLKSFDFCGGGSNSNTDYGNTNLSTDISYELNNPSGTSGTTNWVADYANLNIIYGIKLGSGDVAATASVTQTDDTTAWANVRTSFQFSSSINAVRIMSAVNNNGIVDNLILQSSSDGVTWTTVSTKAPVNIVKGILTFDGFTIAANSYLRFGITWTGTIISTAMSFTGIEVYSYSQCV